MKLFIAAPFRLIAIVMIVTGTAILYAVWLVEDKAEKLPTVKIEWVRFWRHA